MSAPLILVADRVLPMSGAASDAGARAVAVAGGVVLAVGPEEACRAALPAGAETVALPGAALLPGFIDAHVHVLASAAARQGVDVSPHAVTNLAQLLEAVAEAAARAPRGAWVRATGYEETMLAEGRPPSRDELDAAAPGRPVRLIHRTGHAEVLNSPALAAAGIDESTPEPPGAWFGRSTPDGRLDGLLAGMTEAIEAAMPPPDAAALQRAVASWAAERAAEGVTTLVDAGARNGVPEWETLTRLVEHGAIPQRLVVMEGIERLGELPEAGADGRVLRGESKAVLHVLEHADESRSSEVAPGVDALATQVARALAAGRRIAVHAPTPEAVVAALDAFERASAPPGQRLEHAPLLSPALVERIAKSGAYVVGQPGLLAEVAPRYERLIEPGRRAGLQPWRSLLAVGARIAFSSDAPVSRAGPLAAAASASSGRPAALAPEQAIAPLEALRAWTAGAADAGGLADRGRIAVGSPADLVAVAGPLERDLVACRVVLTMIGGEIAFLGDGPRAG